MTISSIAHKFKVSVTYGDGTDSKPTQYTDTHQMVRKPLSAFSYSDQVESGSPRLSFIASQELDADKNIGIVDMSGAMSENAPTIENTEETFRGNSWSSYFKSFLITNKWTVDTPSKPRQPLYYKHVLPATTEEATVFILDENFEALDPYSYVVETRYVIDEADGSETSTVDEVLVYNNYENSFNDDTGDLNVYYITYKTNNSGVQESNTKLLNNVPVYREAVFTDIWTVSLKIKPWVQAYGIEQASNGTYDITLPVSDRYSIKYTSDTRIQVTHPFIDEATQPWFVKVSNGSLSHRYIDIPYTYDITEFDSQAFTPTKPYKIAISELAKKVDKYILKLNHVPTLLGTYNADIFIKDSDNSTVLYALTTDTSKNGNTYSGSVSWDSDSLLSYDVLSGFVQVDFEIKDYYYIYATYYYEEKYYEFTSINMNPLSNNDVLDYNYVLYMVPKSDANQNSTQTVSLHYLKVDRTGTIAECSQDGSYGEPDIETDVVGMSYGKPITARPNLIQYAHRLIATTWWTTDGASIVDHTAEAPNGTLTADIIKLKADTGYHGISQTVYNISGGSTYTFEIYAKKILLDYLCATFDSYNGIAPESSDKAFFNLALGNIGTTSSNVSGATITDVGDGWYKCRLTYSLPADADTLIVGLYTAGIDNIASYTSTSTENSTYIWSPKLLLGTGAAPTDFIHTYTINGNEEHEGTTSRYLILAELSAVQQAQQEMADEIDVRTAGGGISEDSETTVLQTYPAAQWFGNLGLGIGQGLPFPSKSVVVTKLPLTLLSDYGGRFEEDEVRQIVKRHMAFGHYPLIRYHYYRPEISIDEDGVFGTNLVPSPSALDSDPPWTELACTITGDNVLAPNGKVEGDTIAEDGATTIHGAYQELTTSMTAGSLYRVEAYIKPINRTQAALLVSDVPNGVNYGSVYNFSTGEVISDTSSQSDMSASIEDWWFCRVFLRPTYNIASPRILITGADGGFIPYAGANQDSFAVWNVRIIDPSITIEWDTATSDYTFNVYYSTKEDGPFVKHNSTAIVNADPNSYTLDNLNYNTIYYIYVRAIKSGTELPRSNVLKIKTPSISIGRLQDKVLKAEL